MYPEIVRAHRRVNRRSLNQAIQSTGHRGGLRLIAKAFGGRAWCRLTKPAVNSAAATIPP